MTITYFWKDNILNFELLFFLVLTFSGIFYKAFSSRGARYTTIRYFWKDAFLNFEFIYLSGKC